MHITRSFLLLVVALGCLDICSVAATKPPRTTRPAKTTSTTRKADEADLDEDKKYYYRPKPTLKPAQTQLPPVQVSLPPPPPPLYPVPSTYPPFHPKPPHSPYPTTGPAPPPFPPSLYPVPGTKPPYRPTYSPPQTPLPTVGPALPPLPPHNPPSHGGRPGGPITSPTPTPQPIADQFDRRNPDGSYEFRYELPDATVRYERGYFVVYQHKRILVVKGFYSYRLPDRRYYTVFYAADQFGYRQSPGNYSIDRPVLPHSLKADAIPEHELRNLIDSNESESGETSTLIPSDTTLAEE